MRPEPEGGQYGVCYGAQFHGGSTGGSREHMSPESLHLRRGESWGVYPPGPISQSQGLLPGEL